MRGRNRQSVERHYSDHRLPRAWRCPEVGCAHGAKHGADLKKHLKNVHGKIVTVEFCRSTGCYQPGSVVNSDNVPIPNDASTSKSANEGIAVNVPQSGKVTRTDSSTSNSPAVAKNLPTNPAMSPLTCPAGETASSAPPTTVPVWDALPGAARLHIAKSAQPVLSTSRVEDASETDVISKSHPAADNIRRDIIPSTSKTTVDDRSSEVNLPAEVVAEARKCKGLGKKSVPLPSAVCKPQSISPSKSGEPKR